MWCPTHSDGEHTRELRQEACAHEHHRVALRRLDHVVRAGEKLERAHVVLPEEEVRTVVRAAARVVLLESLGESGD